MDADAKASLKALKHLLDDDDLLSSADFKAQKCKLFSLPEGDTYRIPNDLRTELVNIKAFCDDGILDISEYVEQKRILLDGTVVTRASSSIEPTAELVVSGWQLGRVK